MALINSGATGNFIGFGTARKHKLKLMKMDRNVNVYNADGTPNTVIKHQVEVTITIQERTSQETFWVGGLGKEKM